MQLTSNPEKWCAVVNSFAASSKAMASWSKAEECLGSDGISYDALFTGEAGNARTLSYEACRNGYKRFIAVGGDGTVHDVLDGIMSYIDDESSVSLDEFTLAVLPVGSGNDWIKTSGVPNDIVKAAALFSSGRISRQDVVKVTVLDPSSLPEQKAIKVSYMANVGGIGLDAHVCARVNEAKKMGKSGKMLYIKALIYNLIHRVPSSATVLCDQDEIFSGSYISMAFGIGKYSGGGMRQTPDALPDDGLLDMTIIPDLPLLKIAKEAPKLLNGKLRTVKEVTFSKGKTYLVLPDKGAPVPVEVDGEVIGEAPVRFEVLEQQLNILVP